MIYGARTESQFRLSIYHQQISQLYRSLSLSMVASLAMALFLSLTLFSTLPQTALLFWTAGYLLLALAGITCNVVFHKRREWLSNRRWEHLYLALTVAATLMWGIVIVWMFPQTNSSHQALIIFLMGGLHMGAASALSFRLAPMLIFTGTTSILLLWQLAVHPEWLSLVAVGLCLIFLPMVAVTALRNFKNNYFSHLHRLQAAHKSELLQRSERRFQSIVNSAGEILLIHSPKGKIIDANRRACELLGYQDKQQLLGKPIAEVAGEASEIYHNLLRVMADGEPMIYDANYLRRDGTEIPVEACVTNYDDPTEGESVLVLARDLTAKQAQQKELNESRQKLDLHIQSTPLAVIEWDNEFHVKSWNPGAEKIFGFQASEIIGSSGLTTLLPTPYRDKAQHIFQQLLNNQGGRRVTIQNQTKKGEVIICDWYNTPLVDHCGNVLGVASLAMDVTERIRANQAIKKAMRNEQAANNAKSEFLSRMSHELRTPLNAIIGLSNLLQLDEQLNESQLEYINDIRNAGSQLLYLVNEVLDLSCIERGKIELNPTTENLNDLIYCCKQIIEPLIKQQQLTLNYTPLPDDILLVVDKHRFIQILTNLLSNAIKYNRANGTINLETERLGSNTIKINVIDNGIGINEDQQNKIFEPFHRAGAEFSSVEGSGLGLMLSKQLVEKMGGTIEFSSIHGQGSQFWIMLPILAPDHLSDSITPPSA